MTNFEKISKIICVNGGYVTAKDVKTADIPSAMFYRYAERHDLIKLCTGLYATKEWTIDDYFLLQYRYPKLIFSFYCAAYLHGLGDYVPPFLEVTAPRNYRPFSLPQTGIVLHTDTRDAIYSLGIIKVKTMFGNEVFVYDMEKTVCDFIRRRDELDSESFIKCIHYYKRKKEKKINELMKYAKIMKIQNKVTNLMEVILNED